MTQWKDAGKPKRRPRLKTRIRRRVRSEVRRRPLFHCGSCGKQYNNPLGHVCTGGGLKRKRAALERQQATAAKRAREKAARDSRREREETARKRRRGREDDQRRARREREAEEARERRAKAAAAKPISRRPGRPKHDYARCRDHDCERIACEAWREGYGSGYEEGFAEGVAAASAAARSV